MSSRTGSSGCCSARLNGSVPNWKPLTRSRSSWGDDSLPQPDAIIARAALDRRYFQVSDIALALEVVDRSSRFELTRKVSLYASAGVPELWVADLKTGQLNQFWSPQSGVYGEKQRVPLSFELQSTTIAGLVVSGEGLGLP